jgi:hypothetical protein
MNGHEKIIEYFSSYCLLFMLSKLCLVLDGNSNVAMLMTVLIRRGGGRSKCNSSRTCQQAEEGAGKGGPFQHAVYTFPQKLLF